MSTLSAADARRAARNAGAIAAASILSKGAQFFWQLLLARMIGEASYGIYGTVGAFVAIGTSITNFGMGPIVIRDVARAPHKAGQYLTATLFMQTALAGLAILAVNGAALVGGYTADVRAFLALAAINLLADILGNMSNDILLAGERMVATSLISIGHVALLIALAAAALFAGWGLTGVYLATIAAGLLRAAVLWALLWRGGVRPSFPIQRDVALPLLANGAPLALAAFLSLAYQHVDKLMSARLIGTSAAGQITAAFVIIFGVVEVLNTTVLIATYPMMSRYSENPDSETFGFIAEKLAFFTLLIMLPVALVLAVFALEITVPLFGADFSESAGVLRILIWYALVVMIVNVLSQALRVQNRQRRMLAVRALGLALNIALNAVLVLLLGFGLLAMPTASLLAEGVVLLLLLRDFRAAGWSTRRALRAALRLALLGAAAGVGMLLLGAVHPLLGMAAGLLIYAAGVLFAGVIAPDDWDLIYRLVAAMPGGGLVRRYWRRAVSVNW